MSLSDDLKDVVQIKEADYRELISILADPKFKRVDWVAAVDRLSKGEESEEEYLNSLIRILEFVALNAVKARNYDKGIQEISEFVNKASSNDADALRGWERISGSLPALQEFLLAKKESELKNRFSRVTEASITVDIRPIFDMQKESIVKHLFPCVLRIETYDDDSFVCEFYEDTLDELIDELELTKRKIAIFKERYDGK